MGFSDGFEDFTDEVFEHLGDDAVFTPLDGEPIPTRAIKHPTTPVVGELGSVVDTRDSIALPRGAVGLHRKGNVATLGRTFELIGLDDERTDDWIVSFFVLEV